MVAPSKCSLRMQIFLVGGLSRLNLSVNFAHIYSFTRTDPDGDNVSPTPLLNSDAMLSYNVLRCTHLLLFVAVEGDNLSCCVVGENSWVVLGGDFVAGNQFTAELDV